MLKFDFESTQNICAIGSDSRPFFRGIENSDPTVHATPSDALCLKDFSASFAPDTAWMPTYQRNNKSKRAKNLRCFPRCSLLGHKESFCGRSIKVIVWCKSKAISSVKNLRAVAEFATEKSPLRPAGSFVSLNEINRHVHDKSIQQSYLQGTLVQSSEHGGYKDEDNKVLHYEYNKTLRGWHYGFLGSKRTRDMYHNFRCYILEKIKLENDTKVKPGLQENEKYRILASCISPSFQMYCRRRKFMRKRMADYREELLQRQHTDLQVNTAVEDRNFLRHGENIPPHPPNKLIFEHAWSPQTSGTKRKCLSTPPSFPNSVSAENYSPDDSSKTNQIKMKSEGQSEIHQSFNGDRSTLINMYTHRNGICSQWPTTALPSDRSSPIFNGSELIVTNSAVDFSDKRMNLGITDCRWSLIKNIANRLGLLQTPLSSSKMCWESVSDSADFADAFRKFFIQVYQMRSVRPAIPSHVKLRFHNEKLEESERFMLFVLQSSHFRERVYAFVTAEIMTCKADKFKTLHVGLQLFDEMLAEFLENGNNDKKSAASAESSQLSHFKVCPSAMTSFSQESIGLGTGTEKPFPELATLVAVQEQKWGFPHGTPDTLDNDWNVFPPSYLSDRQPSEILESGENDKPVKSITASLNLSPNSQSHNEQQNGQIALPQTSNSLILSPRNQCIHNTAPSISILGDEPQTMIGTQKQTDLSIPVSSHIGNTGSPNGFELDCYYFNGTSSVDIPNTLHTTQFDTGAALSDLTSTESFAFI